MCFSECNSLKLTGFRLSDAASIGYYVSMYFYIPALFTFFNKNLI